MEQDTPAFDLPVTQQQPGGGLAYAQSVPMGMAPVDDLDGGDGFSVMGLLHSLRRQLLLALGLGLLLSTVLAILLWFMIPVSYKAEALLKVNRDQTKGNASDFMIFKETQAALIKSNFVVTAALRDNEINQLSMVKSDSRGMARKQPVAWLAGAVNVMPSETEIIFVSMQGRDKKQTEQILDGVINSYLREIVNKERIDKVDQLSKLRRRYQTAYQMVTKKADEVMKQSELLGAANNQGVMRNLNMAMNRLSGVQTQLDRLQSTYMELMARGQMIQTQLKAGSQMQPNEYELLDFYETHPKYANLSAQIDEYKDYIEQMSTQLRQGSPQLQQYQQEVGRLEAARQRLQAELRPRMIARIKTRDGTSAGSLQRELLMVQSQVQSLQQQQVALKKLEAERLAEIAKFGGGDGQLEARKQDLLALQKDMHSVRTEIGALESEIDGPKPVSVMSAAAVNKSSNLIGKLVQIGGGWFLSLLGTVFAVAYWDYLGKRVNGEEDISKSIRVVGTLPPIQKGLDEETMKISVDGIRTAILFNRDVNTQCVLVTSATGQEGRSTVASQLAVSMGRAGKTTLLIDGDLRNPQQHNIFGVQPHGGLSEMLRAEQTSDQAIVATAVENVWLLGAGRCDQQALQGLSGDQAKAVFEDFRDRFDMIIIDSSPVLTGADSLLLGQFSDSAIMSVRRDVSQLPKVNAAVDRLGSVGIPILGSVVNGSTIELRAGEQRITAKKANEDQPALTTNA